MTMMLKITDDMRAAARKLLGNPALKISPADRDRLTAIADGKRKLIRPHWWTQFFKTIDQQKLAKLQRLADPARNPNEHERTSAARKVEEFKASAPPGMPPQPPPLPKGARPAHQNSAQESRTMTAPTVFHFTDTLRLPWILIERQLSPTRGMAAPDYPRPTFLWATTNAAGDRSAASSGDSSYQLWRQGGTLLVRFVLAAEDFTPWAEMQRQSPQWTPEKIARLERNGRKKGSSPEHWQCRTEPLAIDRWVGIETRSYTERTWKPLDFSAYTTLEVNPDSGSARKVESFQQAFDELCAAAVEIDGRTYVSKRIIPRDGRTLYMAEIMTEGAR